MLLCSSFPGVLHIKALGDFFLVILTELIEHEARPPYLKFLAIFQRFTEDRSLYHECSEQKSLVHPQST